MAIIVLTPQDPLQGSTHEVLSVLSGPRDIYRATGGIMETTLPHKIMDKYQIAFRYVPLG